MKKQKRRRKIFSSFIHFFLFVSCSLSLAFSSFPLTQIPVGKPTATSELSGFLIFLFPSSPSCRVYLFGASNKPSCAVTHLTAESYAARIRDAHEEKEKYGARERTSGNSVREKRC